MHQTSLLSSQQRYCMKTSERFLTLCPLFIEKEERESDLNYSCLQYRTRCGNPCAAHCFSSQEARTEKVPNATATPHRGTNTREHSLFPHSSFHHTEFAFYLHRFILHTLKILFAHTRRKCIHESRSFRAHKSVE